MGLLDLVKWVTGSSRREDTYEVTDRDRTLATGARGDHVTPELLALPGERTNLPLVEYLDEDEQPHYVFLGTRLLLSDAEDAHSRKDPARKLLCAVSDQRILFVVGGYLADDILEVPLEDIGEIYVDRDPPRRHLIVEGEREGEPMTFFAEVTIDPHHEAMVEAVEYVRSAPSRRADEPSDVTG